MRELFTSSEPRWENTHDMVERLRTDLNFEEPDLEAPAGYFGGRKIISRDNPINGGIYLGSGAREAIVVDDGKYLDLYGEVYSRYVSAVYAIVEYNPEASVLDRILKPALGVTRNHLPFNEEAVGHLTRGKRDKKMNLAQFIYSRAGVCRHQALLVGYLLERFKAEGELMPEDEISVDRNTIRGRGGHAWVRFTASDKTPYVIDPAQNRVASLSNLENVFWDYRRPGEE